MKPILTSAVVAALFLGAPDARAEDYVDRMISEMISEGFELIKKRKTVSGHTRLRGFRDDQVRIVVIDPETGRIHRQKRIQRHDPFEDTPDGTGMATDGSMPGDPD